MGALIYKWEPSYINGSPHIQMGPLIHKINGSPHIKMGAFIYLNGIAHI